MKLRLFGFLPPMIALPAMLAADVSVAMAKVDPSANPVAACAQLGTEFGRSGEVLKAYRAYTGEDGESHLETVDLKGKTGVYFGGKVSLTQFALGDPSGVVIVHGQSGVEIPAHPSPYREMFLIVGGSAYTVLKDGTRVELLPGTIMMSEDQASHTGRGGGTGPCGYVAINLQFKPVAP